jgi:hypothetical protein
MAHREKRNPNGGECRHPAAWPAVAITANHTESLAGERPCHAGAARCQWEWRAAGARWKGGDAALTGSTYSRPFVLWRVVAGVDRACCNCFTRMWGTVELRVHVSRTECGFLECLRIKGKARKGGRGGHAHMTTASLSEKNERRTLCSH